MKLKSLAVVSRDFSQLFEKSSASSSLNSTPFFWQARNLSRKKTQFYYKILSHAIDSR